MENRNNKWHIIVSVLVVGSLLLAVIGVTFAAFNYSKTGEKVNTITTGTIIMSYTEETNGINLTNAFPMTDDIGMTLDKENQYFDFTVSATITGDIDIAYSVNMMKELESSIPDTGVKVYLTSMDENIEEKLEGWETPKRISELSKSVADTSITRDGQYVLTTRIFKASDVHRYRLRMWVADDYEVTGATETYKARVNVYGTTEQ